MENLDFKKINIHFEMKGELGKQRILIDLIHDFKTNKISVNSEIKEKYYNLLSESEKRYIVFIRREDSQFINIYSLEQINSNFTLKQPEDKTVPLEQKVYDFVDVECRDDDTQEWKPYKLICVIPKNYYPFRAVYPDYKEQYYFKQARFI